MNRSLLTTIAIVEDDRDFRNTLKAFVDEAPGFRCVCACDTAEAALQTIPKLLPDVVLMDIHLPNMSGVACTRYLKEVCPSLRILILTVYEDNERIFGALKAGASGYLLKRAEPGEIIRAINEVKLGGAPMSSHIASRVWSPFTKATGQCPRSKSCPGGKKKFWRNSRRGTRPRKSPVVFQLAPTPFILISIIFMRSFMYTHELKLC